MSARDLSKARIKAHEKADKAELAVHAAEGRLLVVETTLASGVKGIDMVALAAEHTRVKVEVDAAVTAWERASAEADALGH